MNKNLIIFCVIIAGAVLFWFYREGRLGAILPWVLIAVCPLMHLFMMKGMHHGGADNSDSAKDKKNQSCH